MNRNIFLILIILFSIIACSKTDDPGIGGDPNLSTKEVIFDSKQGTATITAQRELSQMDIPFIQEIRQYDCEQITNEKGEIISLRGDWYFLQLSDDFKSITITVSNNDTGIKRELEIPVRRINWHSRIIVIQNP